MVQTYGPILTNGSLLLLGIDEESGKVWPNDEAAAAEVDAVMVELLPRSAPSIEFEAEKTADERTADLSCRAST